jgi:hypothetical protein
MLLLLLLGLQDRAAREALSYLVGPCGVEGPACAGAACLEAAAQTRPLVLTLHDESCVGQQGGRGWLRLGAASILQEGRRLLLVVGLKAACADLTLSHCCCAAAVLHLPHGAWLAAQAVRPLHHCCWGR